jgi:DNA-binding LacI/PurR family transcriptional regulator
MRGKMLSSKRSFQIGLVLERPTDVLESDPFFGAFIAGVEQAIAPHDYALVLQVAESRERELDSYREMAASERVDGVLLNEIRVDDPRAALLAELRLPAVAVSPWKECANLPMVCQASAPGIAAATRHLIKLGHTRIAHVCGPKEYVHTHERLQAWEATLVEAGLQPGPVLQGDFGLAGGTAAAEELLGLNPSPTAVVCVNDLCAIGLQLRLQQAGLSIPKDISITGFDGITIGEYVTPALTTVQSTPTQVGKQAAALLLAHIDDPKSAPMKVEVPAGELVIRGSTGRR